MGVAETVDPLSKLSLPPGFRFNPTDEELMVNYLCPKVAGENPPLVVIGDLDLYKHDPWLLPSKALFGEKEWYFFSPRDRKYPNGSRPNRVAGSGYWKATGTDKVIASEGKKVGIKKSLVFYVGKAPTGSKTNWIMHEYRLLEPQRRAGSSKLDDWVLCRIYKKNSSAQRAAGNLGMGRTECSRGSSSSSSSQFDDKQNIQNAGYCSGNNFNWTTFPGLNNTFAGQGGGIQIQSHNQTQHGGMSSMNYNQSNMYPSVDSGYGKMTEQEVQSGFLNQPAHNSGFLYPNAYGGQGFINSIDPYAAMRYQNQPGSSGDRN